MNIQTDTTIPLKHYLRRHWYLGWAMSFLWVGFMFAVGVAYSENNLPLAAVSTMLLGIGLLIFCGVGFFVWAMPVSRSENGDENGD